jgi:hypothetical protein
LLVLLFRQTLGYRKSLEENMRSQTSIRAAVAFFAVAFAFILSQTIAVNAATSAADQATACTYTLSPASINISHNAGSVSFNVITSEPDCAWTATVTAGDYFVTITSGASGTGNGTVTFSVTANTITDVIRVGRISVAGQNFIVQQGPAPCSYALASNGTNVPASGGNGSVTVITQQACVWLVTSNSPWITNISAPGWGPGTATFTVQPNAGAERTGTRRQRQL